MMLSLHLPNARFASDDWQRIRACGGRDYVDLCLFAERWPWIMQQQPDARIHARGYKRGDLGNAEDEAQELSRLIVRYGQYVTTWRWRNEPNLESPGVTPEQWRRFLVAFGRAIHRMHRGVRLYAPAVAPWHTGWLDWLQATIDAVLELDHAGTSAYVGIDGHVYGDPGQVDNLLWEYRRRWDGKLLISEYNFGAGREYSLQQWAWDLPKVAELGRKYRCETICLFIWRWQNPDMALPTLVDVKGTPVESALAELNRGEDNVNEDLTVRFKGEWETWRQAGGDRHHFAAHLVGRGLIPPTKDLLVQIAKNAEASAKQLQEGLGKLPF